MDENNDGLKSSTYYMLPVHVGKESYIKVMAQVVMMYL